MRHSIHILFTFALSLGGCSIFQSATKSQLPEVHDGCYGAACPRDKVMESIQRVYTQTHNLEYEELRLDTEELLGTVIASFNQEWDKTGWKLRVPIEADREYLLRSNCCVGMRQLVLEFRTANQKIGVKCAGDFTWTVIFYGRIEYAVWTPAPETDSIALSERKPPMVPVVTSAPRKDE